MKIIVIRHGTAVGNSEKRFVGVTDAPLTPEGECEARLAAKKALPVGHVYTSPLSRCRKTAQMIWPAAEVTVIDRLRESDFGLFEGKSHQELIGDPLYESWLENPEGAVVFTRAESPSAFSERVACAWRLILDHAEENAYENVAVVTHGGVIMRLMSAFAEPLRDFYAWMPKNCEGYITETISGGTGMRLVSEFHLYSRGHPKA